MIYSWSRLDRPSALAETFLTQVAVASPGARIALPNVTRVGGRLAVGYRRSVGNDADLSLSGSLRYVGKSRLGIGPVFDAEQGGYLQTGLSAKLDSGRYLTVLSVTNLFGAIGNRFSLGTPFALPGGDAFTPQRPRTVTIGFSAAF